MLLAGNQRTLRFSAPDFMSSCQIYSRESSNRPRTYTRLINSSTNQKFSAQRPEVECARALCIVTPVSSQNSADDKLRK